MFNSGLGPMHFQFSQFTNGIIFKTLEEKQILCARGLVWWPVEKTDDKNALSWHFPFMVWMELEVNWPQASLCFVHWWPTLFSFVLLLFCSWCLFISQRLCVNMSIWIKHIVCIYCLFTCIACKNNHSSFHVYSLPPAFLKLWVGTQYGPRVCFVSGPCRIRVLVTS